MVQLANWHKGLDFRAQTCYSSIINKGRNPMDNFEYDINGNDNFEYAQGLCRHSEDYYGLDLSSDAAAEAAEQEWLEYMAEQDS